MQREKLLAVGLAVGGLATAITAGSAVLLALSRKPSQQETGPILPVGRPASVAGELDPNLTEGSDQFIVTLEFPKVHFDSVEPIRAEVFIRNSTSHDVELLQFHPYSSSIRSPQLLLARGSDEEEFALPVGLYSNERRSNWTVTSPPGVAHGMGKFTVPAGEMVLMFSCDLRQVIDDARAYCSEVLDSHIWDGPEHARLMGNYREIVKFGTSFALEGGSYRVRILAHRASDEVALTVEPVR